MSRTLSLLTFVKENWTWIAPAIYAYATILGVVSSWVRFREYGINILDFAELNDFMLAAFRDPITLLAAVGVYFVGFLYASLLEWQFIKLAPFRERNRVRFVRLKTRVKSYVIGVFLVPSIGKDSVKQRYRWSHRRSLRVSKRWNIRFEKFNALFFRGFRLLSMVAIVLGPFFAAVNTSERLPIVDVQLRSYPNGKTEADYERLRIIGTTDKFIFLYRISSETTITVPIPNLGSISSVRDIESNQ